MTDRLYQILDQVTTRFRKGPMVERSTSGLLDVIDIYEMPHVDDAPANLVKIDVGVPMVIGVDVEAALPLKDEVRRLLLELKPLDEWQRGPSYITVGAWLGSQDAAFSLFALGEVLDLWHVITPQRLGETDEEVIRRAVGSGFVMITGLR